MRAATGPVRGVAALLAWLLALAVLTAPPAAADTSRSSSGPGFLSALLVDEVRGRVLVSGGPDQRHVDVLDAAGVLVRRVDGLPGAQAMVLSPDGAQLYVLLSQSSEIAVLDADSLIVLRRLPVPGFRQRHLALAGGRLWTTTVGGQAGVDDSNVVGVDLLTGAAERIPMRFGASLIASSPGGSALALASGDISPPRLATFDVTGEPRLLAEASTAGNPLRQLAVSSDQGTLYVAAHAGGVQVWRTSDLARLSTLAPGGERRDGVAAEGRGLAVAAGPVLELRDPASSEVLASSPLDGIAASAGVAVGRGGSLAAVLVDRTQPFFRYDRGPMAVHVLSLADRRPATTAGLTPFVRRSFQQPSATAEVVGRLATLGSAPQPLAGRVVAVRRTGPGGTVVLDRLVTADDGSFSVVDSPRAPGSYVYEVDYAGDRDTAPTTGVLRHEVRREVRTTPVDASGGALVLDGDQLLVTDPTRGQVRRLSRDGTVLARSAALPGAHRLALGQDVLYVTSPELPDLVALDPTTLAERGRYALAGTGCADEPVVVGARVVVHTRCTPTNDRVDHLVLVDPLVPLLTSTQSTGATGGVELASSGTRVAAVGDGSGSVATGTALYETSSGRLQETARTPEGSGRVAWSADGSSLVVGLMQRLDPSTLAPRDSIDRGAGVRAVTGDGEQIAALQEGVPRVFSAATGQQTSAGPSLLSPVSAMAFGPDRLAVLAAGALVEMDLRPLRAAAVTADGPAEARSGAPASVSGRLADATGTPLAWRELSVGLGRTDSLRLADAVVVTTDADGRYRATVTPSEAGTGVWRARYDGGQDAEPASGTSPAVRVSGADSEGPAQPAPSSGPEEPSPEPSPPGPTPTAQPRGTQAGCPPETPEDGFADVPASSTHERAIDCIVWWGVARGRSSTSYAPAETVTRGQMATFIANTVLRSGGSLPEPTRDHFPDDDGSLHEASINRLAEAGIVAGRPDGRYAQELAVTRDAMAKFLALAVEHRTGQQLAADADYFVDDRGNTHERNINKVAQAGLTGGAAPGEYRPSLPVRRDQMGSFLARVLDLLVTGGHARTP